MKDLASRFRRAIAVIAVLLSGATAAHAAADKFLYASPGTVSYTMAPYFFADALGFYRDQNLDFSVIALQGSGEILPQLIQGRILAAMITPDLLVVSRAPGKPDFPVRFVYNVYRHAIWQMAVLAQSPIRSFKDLGGKKIGVGALTFANVVQTKALLRRNGVDPASVSFVAVGNGGGAIETLRRGQIDALNLYASVDAVIESEGIAIRRIAYPPEFANTSSHGLVFADTTIKERPDLVIRFGRAVAEGTVACAANPGGCLDAYWKVHPTQRPQPMNEAVHQRWEKLLEVTLDTMTAFDGGPQLFGSYTDADWMPTINSLRLGGQIPEAAKIDLASLYTNAFVKDFNQFDRAAVIARAKAYRP